MPELAPDPTQLSRLELLQLAQSLGVSDADVMTRAELRAAIDKARRPDPPRLDHYPITWVSVARRLLASVVERGLNLPDAASLIRGDTKLTSPPKPPPPVATVTLARIYGAQGHVARAIATLDEVLESDPDHEIARELRNQLELRRLELVARAAADEADARRGRDDEEGLTSPYSDSLPRPAGFRPARDAGAPAGSSASGFAAASPGPAGGLSAERPRTDWMLADVRIRELGSAGGEPGTRCAEPQPLQIQPASEAVLVPDTERFPEPPPAAEPPPFLESASVRPSRKRRQSRRP
jgi:hypothetical protein